MKVSDYYYDLPKNLIAQDPLEKRDNSRLLVVDKNSGKFYHKMFSNIIDYLEEGDTLVLNDTKVIPARLIGTIVDNDSTCEIFLIKRISTDTWECLVKPGKKLKIGKEVIFGNGILKAQIIDIKEDGNRIVKFIFDGIFEEILNELGEVPLPPYITHKLKDKDRYQTVYAKYEGSVAAPTAGLHFTNELLKQIEDKGINIAKLTLHVSLGTFRPVKVENIEDHVMHSELVHINKQTADLINKTILNNKKIICVGTTSCRSLESAAYFDESSNKYLVKEFDEETNIFIYEGYKFKIMNALLTNFHLPESTLLMLVSAFCGKENVLNAYKEAIKEQYRFFSFGDASLFIDIKE